MNSSVCARSLLNSARCYSAKCLYSTDVDVIKIPKRIPRGPTDILRALARTHKRDTSAPHYKYHDDPYLIPYSNSSKRSYALSLEAGRKSAYWIQQEHADLFNHSVADPKIEVFIPSKLYQEDTEVSIDDLKQTISKYAVSDVITVYNSLEKQGIEIDAETKQSLLEILCFYNAEEGVAEEWFEERWFRSTSKKHDLVKKTWKDNGLAEKIFRSIKPPTSESYCTIICGMAKYGQAEGAMKLFNEAIDNNIPVNVDVYNSVIAKVSVLRESHDLMWILVKDLLGDMKTRQMKPNLGTFNAILETLSHMPMNRNSNKFALQMLSEMKQMKIEPSLSSFYYLLLIFYGGSKNSGILYDIIDYLQDKSFEVKDANDCKFFVTAMEMCRHKLHQVSLAYRINKLLLHDDNYNLIGDSFKESQYYRFFFSLLCEGEPLDEFMNVYNELVPHLYIPEPSVMMEVLNSIEINFGYKYIPQLWTDMTKFDLSTRQNLLIKILQLMTQTDEQELELQEQFVKIGWNIWEKLENQTRERNTIEWTGGMLSDLLKIFATNKNLSKASIVFDKLDKSQNNLTGEPSMDAVRIYVELCIDQRSADSAIKCVRYCKDMGFGEADDFAALIETKLDLSPQQKQRLNALMGKLPSS